MTITVSVPDQLAQLARAEGLSVEAYVEKLAEQAAEKDSLKVDIHEGHQQDAIDSLLAFRCRHGLTLGRDPQVSLRSWIHEEHKY